MYNILYVKYHLKIFIFGINGITMTINRVKLSVINL